MLVDSPQSESTDSPQQAMNATQIGSPLVDARPVKVAYMMSRFPKLTETFVLFEMRALERQGADVEVFPLLRARNSTTHPEAAGLWTKAIELFRRPANETVMHPEAKPFVARAHFAPFLDLKIVAAQFRLLFRRPVRYLHTLATLIRANWGSPNYLLGGFALFPKAVYFAHRMQQLGITHIHAHFANHPAAAAYVINRLTGIPYSFTAHGADLQVDQHMLREKVSAAKFVVSISNDNRDLIENVCGANASRHVEIVRCGVDTSIFRASGREHHQDVERPSKLRIVCTGTLYEVKGQTVLIEACRVLHERGVSFECHLIGEGPMREELQHQADEDGISDYVVFHGRQTRQQIADRLRDSDVLAAPSVPTAEGRREGIPVVLMEAMASGLPVVASRISGIPELVEHDKTGLLIPPRDPNALADALERLSQDEELRAHLGNAGRERVVEEFDVDRNAGRLLNLFSTSETS
jgi:glycosyltransferase involved in cell wall biosynthesis